MPTLKKPTLFNCGSFVKPQGSDTDVAIVKLYSKNKRFVFQMMNRGKCTLKDLNSGLLLFSTDDYIYSTVCPKMVQNVQDPTNSCTITPAHLLGEYFNPTALADQANTPNTTTRTYGLGSFTALTFSACTVVPFYIQFTAGNNFDLMTQCYAYYNDTNTFTGIVQSLTLTSVIVTNVWLMNIKVLKSSISTTGVTSDKWTFAGLKRPTFED